MPALPYADLSYGTDMSESFRVREVAYGDGYDQRSEDGLNTQRQVWQLSWKKIPDTLAEELRLFFKGLGGSATLDWTPYGQADQLKFTANDWRSTPSGAMVTDCSIKLTQRFDL